jgi:hypothetical protein
LAAGAGAALLITAALWQAAVAQRRHKRQTDADRQRRLTESFSKAIEQLGSEKVEVHLGGIYSLERISKESPSDYWTVMESLTAFVREHSRRTETERIKRVSEHAYFLWLEAGRPEGNSDFFWAKAVEADEPGRRPATDIAAVLTVVGRRSKWGRRRESTNDWHLDLSRAILKSVDLRGAHLEGAILNGAHLEGAILIGAHLEEANLFGAHLEGAFLRRAHLEGADLNGAHLERANLRGVHLEGAYLIGTHLEGAYLIGTHLEGAHLDAAHLEGAMLIDTHLEGAHLNGTYLKGAYFSKADLKGADLNGADQLVEESAVNRIRSFLRWRQWLGRHETDRRYEADPTPEVIKHLFAENRSNTENTKNAA